MSMTNSAFEVMVVLSKGKPKVLEFWLDNEEAFELAKDPNLFRELASIDDLISNIPLAFRLKGDDDDTDIAEFISDFDYDDSYGKFLSSLAKLSLKKVKSVVLMTNTDREFGDPRYQFNWIKYDLAPYRVITGTSGSNDSGDSEDFICSLAEVTTGKEVR